MIVGHFISLDLDFINREARRINGAPLKNHVVDTCNIHEWIRFNDGDFSRHYGGLAQELNLFHSQRNTVFLPAMRTMP